MKVTVDYFEKITYAIGSGDTGEPALTFKRYIKGGICFVGDQD